MPMLDRNTARRAVDAPADDAGLPTPGKSTLTERLGAGAPVPAEVRAIAEAHLGDDLSGVRVHTDEPAREAAAGAGARAFAHGDDIVLGPGEHPDDVELMTHELTHVVQQRGAGAPSFAPLSFASIDHPAEAEAETFAHRAATGAAPTGRAPNATPAAGALHRNQAANAGPQAKARALMKQVLAVLDANTYAAIRDAVKVPMNQASERRARERFADPKQHPDLTGIGSMQSLQRFAASVQAMKKTWQDHAPAARLHELHVAANADLHACDLPAIHAFTAEPMTAKASTTSSQWSMRIRAALIEDDELDDGDAAGLCEAVLHECRHLEQTFLAARWAAGHGQPATTVALPADVAAAAAAKPIRDTGGDDRERALAQSMYGIETDGNAHMVQVEAGLASEKLVLEARRVDVFHAMNQVDQLAPTDTALAALTAARDALLAQARKVHDAYVAYRALANEADAHEVGTAAELAFKAQP
jgi:hypothetical protein